MMGLDCPDGLDGGSGQMPSVPSDIIELKVPKINPLYPGGRPLIFTSPLLSERSSLNFGGHFFLLLFALLESKKFAIAPS